MSQPESPNARYRRYKILSGKYFLVPGVLDWGVDVIALVSDVLNLGGDVGVLVFDVRDLGVDIGDLVADVLVLGVDRESVLVIEWWRGVGTRDV